MSLMSTIASVFDSRKPVTAGIGRFDPSLGEENAKSRIQAFQYFPEKINDSKAVEYSSKTVPGGSHPIYTFISGGERTISFDAIFCDDSGGVADDAKSALDILAGKKTFSLRDKNERDVVSIKEALAYTRSFLYPTYSLSVAKAPSLIILYLPQSGIISNGHTDSIVGFLRRADIVYESFYRSGKPRLVSLNMEIVEVIQDKEGWQFQDGVEDAFQYNKPMRFNSEQL